MFSASSSPLSVFARTPSLPDSPSFRRFVVETLTDTIRVDAPVAVAPAPLLRRSDRKGKGTTTKSDPPNRSNHLNDPEPVRPKRGRGRPRKTKTEPASAPPAAPSRSNNLNDSDLPTVAPSAPAPATRGRRPPKRKAAASTSAVAPPAAKKVRVDAPAQINSSDNKNDPAPTRPKRGVKLTVKAREAQGEGSAAPVLEAAPAPPLTKAQKGRNAKRGYSGAKTAPMEERVHALDHWKEKGEVTEEIWKREFGAVVPAANPSKQVTDQDDGEEEDMKLRASFYTNEMRVTHHPDRAIYKEARFAKPARGEISWGRKMFHHAPELAGSRRKENELEKAAREAREHYAWHSVDEHHTQAPESNVRGS